MSESIPLMRECVPSKCETVFYIFKDLSKSCVDGDELKGVRYVLSTDQKGNFELGEMATKVPPKYVESLEEDLPFKDSYEKIGKTLYIVRILSDKDFSIHLKKSIINAAKKRNIVDFCGVFDEDELKKYLPAVKEKHEVVENDNLDLSITEKFEFDASKKIQDNRPIEPFGHKTSDLSPVGSVDGSLSSEPIEPFGHGTSDLNRDGSVNGSFSSEPIEPFGHGTSNLSSVGSVDRSLSSEPIEPFGQNDRNGYAKNGTYYTWGDFINFYGNNPLFEGIENRYVIEADGSGHAKAGRK